MAFYAEEEGVWKCLKHPSKRRGTGICPACLRERLSSLCPDCRKVRPCECCSTTTTSSSSSSSSSFSIFSSSSYTAAATAAGYDGVGAVGRVGSLIGSEPAFRRSRSVGIPFLRSRFAAAEKENCSNSNNRNNFPASGKLKPPFWSIFKSNKSKRCEDLETRDHEGSKENENSNSDSNSNSNNHCRSSKIDDFERMIMRSRSVSASMTKVRGGGDAKSSPAKGKGWNFPSPMKVFRQKSLSKVVQDRSPLHRG